MRRGAKLFMAALLKARGCTAALSTLASPPLPTAAPRLAATGPAPSARGADRMDGGTGGHRGAAPGPCGTHSPPAVLTVMGSELGCGGTGTRAPLGRSPKTGLGEGHRGSCGQAAHGQAGSRLAASGAALQTCPAVRVRGCAWLVWQPKPSSSLGSAAPAAAHCQDRHARGAAEPPWCQPASPPAAIRGEATAPLGTAPVTRPIVAGSDPVQHRRAAVARGAPRRLLARCAGKSAAFASDGKSGAGGGGGKRCLLYHLMTLLLMEGAAEWLAGFLEPPLGKARRLFPAQHRRRMLPPSRVEPHTPAVAAPQQPSGHAPAPLRGVGHPASHLPGRTRGVPTSHRQTHRQAKTRCGAGEARPAWRDPAGALAMSACRGGILGRGKGWVTCRTGAGAWGSRTSRFRQQRGERRKMPQTPLERWSVTESRQPWEGWVAPTRAASWGAPGSRHRHAPQKCPLLPLQASAPKSAAPATWVFAVLEGFARSVPGRFWGALAPGLKPRRAPSVPPRALTCKSSLGSPSAAARVVPGSQWWIRDTWSQPGLPGAAHHLTPATGEEKKRKKRGFLGRAYDGVSCCRSSQAGWVCGTGSGVGSGRQGTAAPPAPAPSPPPPDPLLIPNPSQPCPLPPAPQRRCSPQSSGAAGEGLLGAPPAARPREASRAHHGGTRPRQRGTDPHRGGLTTHQEMVKKRGPEKLNILLVFNTKAAPRGSLCKG